MGQPQIISLGYIVQHFSFTYFSVGVAPGLYVQMVDTRCYNKFLDDTLKLFDLVNSDGVTTVPERESLIKTYLFRQCRLKKYHDVLS
jgi:hypothetical protein